MTQPLPPQTSGQVQPRRRWGRVVLLVLGAGISVIGWHVFTGQFALYRLRKAGFYTTPHEAFLEARLWEAFREDRHQLFHASTWKAGPSPTVKDNDEAAKLPNYDTIATALRRVNPGAIEFTRCDSIRDVGALRGLPALRKLYLGGCLRLQTLDGLSDLASLKELDVTATELRDVKAVGRLIGLQKLRLSDSDRLQDVDSIGRLASLKTLDLSYCSALQDMDGIKGLTSLEELDLSYCPALRNLDGLEGHKQLKRLDLRWCALLKNADILKDLTALQFLNLRDCSALQNVDGLMGLTALTTLDLERCAALQDVNGLKGLTALRKLHLNSCKKLQNVDGLKRLPALEILGLEGCPNLPPEQIAALKVALPHTKIFSGGFFKVASSRHGDE